MFFWPFSNAHELNLDWIILQIKQQDTNLQNFVALNTIKYADPFQWSITGQYAQNTLVIDPSDGTAYLSIKPVPLGVQITNTEYWTPVFTLQNFIDPLKAAICRSVPQQEDGQAATQAIPANSLFFVGDTLCTNSAEIPVTSLVIIGSNCQQISVEELLLAEQQAREQADEQLGQQITQEQQAREQADSQLSQQITQEQTAREEADTQLQTKITAEQTAREQADSRLENSLDTANTDIDALQADVADLKSKAAIFEPEQNTDISTELNSRLKNNSVVLAPGTYNIGSPITIPNGRALFGSGSLLIVNADMDRAITVGDVLGEGDNSGDVRTFTGLFDISINCDAKCDGVDVNCKTAFVSNIRITNPKEIGLSIYKDATSASPADATVTNCNVFSSGTPQRIFTYAYYINGTDNNFIMCRSKYSKYGFYQTSYASSLYCTNCHPLGTDSANDEYANSVGFRIIATCTLIGCYADNFNTGFLVENGAPSTGTYIFDKCCYYNYEYNTALTRYAFRTPTIATHTVIESPEVPDRPDVYKWYLDDTADTFNFYRALSYKTGFQAAANEPVNWKPDDFGNLMNSFPTTRLILESRGETSIPIAYFPKMGQSPVVRLSVQTTSGSVLNAIFRINSSNIAVIYKGKYVGFTSAPSLQFYFDTGTSGCWVYLKMPTAPAVGTEIDVEIIGGMPLRLPRRSGSLDVTHGSQIGTITPENISGA